ncbi:EF-hand domain-containing protein [Luteolibacter flavescens]|uniref:EF-hand domain-containing protein n=1 Tax=Luteolibacter flavescens TaxID=1859460 RepID=A0ABT3FJ91_9BACT|nr:EF-hand domain-containing protein [Luteolibacter flavescens]MCW1883638.1 EF-hand domain-containing protein [Luteolibacter flavescens]
MNSSHTAWIAFLLAGTALSQEPPKTEDARPAQKEGAKDRARPGKENKEKDKDGKPQQWGGRMVDLWKKADADGDGFISMEEFATMERPSQLTPEKREEIFKRLDKNGDGRIGPDELPRRPERMQPLEEVDADKDGRIVFEEFKNLGFVAKLPEERQRKIFERMDRDGDGALTAKDRPEGPPHREGRWNNGNKDGKTEGNKGGRGGHPMEMIRRLDQNGDGALSFEEFRQAGFLKGKSEDEQEDVFEKMDRNKDLKIDATDFPPPPEGPKPDKAEKPSDAP